MKTDRSTRASGRPGLWSALSVPVFRVLVAAQFVATTAIWLHTVATQWVLTVAGASAGSVAAVQAALTLPFFALALPAGYWADASDRRRIMVGVTAAMAVTSTALCALAGHDLLTPAALIAATSVLGVGLVVTVVGWQSIMPELVGRRRMMSATTLDGMAFNAARAVGPAVGGFLLASAGVAWVFAIDALVFAIAAIIDRWRIPPHSTSVGRPGLRSEIASGLRFVRHSAWMRRALVRLTMFSFPAAAFWGLFPVIADDLLGMNSVEFGLAFGVIGIGAVLGPVLLQPARARLRSNIIIMVGCCAYAAAMSSLVLTSSTTIVIAGLFLIGTAWVLVQSTWLSESHQVLPAWVRARSIAIILLTHQACQGVGALAWGQLADVIGIAQSTVVAALLMLAGATTVAKWGLLPVSGLDPVPVEMRDAGEAPDNAFDQGRGPLLVVVEYRVPVEARAQFLVVIRRLGFARRRLGAIRWNVFVDPERADAIVETFLVRSWGEYVDVRERRWTVPERTLQDAARALCSQEPTTRTLVSVARSARRGARARID